MTANHRLEARQVCCARGDRQLFRCLDFQLRAGQLMYLRGPNGSGKTTLLRTLAGLLRPEAGEVLWDGEPIQRRREAFHAELLYLGHLNALKEDLDAVENLRMDGGVRGRPLERDDAWRLLQEIGLRGHEDLPVKYLSQGQKRRVALARLWRSRAALWILDEPFSALDVTAVEALQAVIRAHLERGGMAIVTTHQEVPLTSGTICRVTLGSAVPEVAHA